MDFSIVVPTFNCQKYLEVCLKSIVSQKHNGKTQIIVVDNISTDDTLKIAKRYNAEIVCEKDKGEPDALNKGMKLAGGDIVAWLDSDDLYEPNAFLIAEHDFELHHQIDWLYGKSYFINEDGEKVRRIITRLKQLLQSNYSYDKLCNLCFISQPSVFMRKDFQKKVGDFNVEYPLIFDYEYWLRAGIYSSPDYIPHYLSSMRAHEGSNSVKFSTRQMQESLDLVYRFKPHHHYLFYGWRVMVLMSTIIYYKTIGKYI